MKKNPKDGKTLPKHVVNLLSEYTLGGFIIFYFNAQTGRPEQIMDFDSPAHALALQKHISDWSEAIHEVNISNSVHNIQNALEGLKSNEEGEDEEDEGEDSSSKL